MLMYAMGKDAEDALMSLRLTPQEARYYDKLVKAFEEACTGACMLVLGETTRECMPGDQERPVHNTSADLI